jgi:6-methylsalicylate decarboxylase
VAWQALAAIRSALEEITPMTTSGRIDVHQHVLPPRYAGWLRDNGIRPGGIGLPDWSPPAALKFMDRHGIATGVLSVATAGPGAHHAWR